MGVCVGNSVPMATAHKTSFKRCPIIFDFYVFVSVGFSYT